MRPALHDTLGRWTPTVHAGRPRIVVADDDRDLRELLAQALRLEGLEVVEALDGWDLLALVRDLPSYGEPGFDAVVSDLRMPGVSGLDVLEELRLSEPQLPFFLVTAYDDQDTKRRAHALGAAWVLHKPIDVDALRRAVLDAVGPHKGSSAPRSTR